MGHLKRYSIGIDIGGTKMLAALLNDRFRVLSEIKTKTRPEKGEGHFLQILKDAVHYVLRDARVSKSEVLGIGVGCPGFIDSARGIVAASPNISFLKSYPLARRIS